MEVEGKEIRREDVLEKHAPWVIDMDVDVHDHVGGVIERDFSDNVSSISLSFGEATHLNLVILQQMTLTCGSENTERLKLLEILKWQGNKCFDKHADVIEELHYDGFIESARNGDVLHFIGHSTHTDDVEEAGESVNTGAVLMRRSSDGSNTNTLISVSDINLSAQLGLLRSDYPVKLVFLSMCDKFALACMILCRMNQSFHVICWHGNVSATFACLFSTRFYKECATKFDVVNAFDIASHQLMGERSSELSQDCYPCLMHKLPDGDVRCVLLRANWKQDNDIDRSTSVRFKELCDRDWDSEVARVSQPTQLPEGDRGWYVRKNNKIGFNEKRALKAIGFIIEFGDRPKEIGKDGYMVNSKGRVTNVFDFWVGQPNHIQRVWNEEGQTENWDDLWSKILPKVVADYNNLQNLQQCMKSLQKAIRLRKKDIEYWRNHPDPKKSPTQNQKLIDGHEHMYQQMEVGLLAIVDRIDQLTLIVGLDGLAFP